MITNRAKEQPRWRFLQCSGEEEKNMLLSVDSTRLDCVHRTRREQIRMQDTHSELNDNDEIFCQHTSEGEKEDTNE